MPLGITASESGVSSSAPWHPRGEIAQTAQQRAPRAFYLGTVAYFLGARMGVHGTPCPSWAAGQEEGAPGKMAPSSLSFLSCALSAPWVGGVSRIRDSFRLGLSGMGAPP